MDSEPRKRCRQCREVKPLDQFVRDRGGRRSSYAYNDPRAYRARCSVCEITNRTAPKLAHREHDKARTCRARHARRLNIAVDRLEDFYGWDLDRMEADIRVVIEHGCPRPELGGCGQPVLNLPDVTLDIIDPDLPPHYGINTRWKCATCNRRKGRKSDLHAAIEEAERQAIVRMATRLGEQSFDQQAFDF